MTIKMKTIYLSSIFLFHFLCSNGQLIDVYKRPEQHEPDRSYDAIHYCIKLNVDPEGKTLRGQNTITLKPLNDDLRAIVLDAVSLVVTDVMDIKGTPLDYNQDE